MTTKTVHVSEPLHAASVEECMLTLMVRVIGDVDQAADSADICMLCFAVSPSKELQTLLDNQDTRHASTQYN